MRQQLKTDLFYKSCLLAIQASYKALIETISLEELEVNKKLRTEIRKIKRQIEMIEEMNQSFESKF